MIGSEPIHVPRADAVDCPRHLRAPIYIARTVLGGPRRDGDDLAFRGGEAEERGDVVAHLGEGVATQLPSLIEVVEPIEAGALVADGEFGDVVLDAEAAHQRAAGPAQVVRGELDASGAL